MCGEYLPVIRKHMMSFPGVREGICFGTTAFYVGKNLLTRMKEDGETLMVHTPDRDEWTKLDAHTFFVTPHYDNYPAVLVRLASVAKADLQKILTAAWRSRAGVKLQKQFDGR